MDDISLSQTPEITCPHCGQTFTTEIWFIVDLDERPDLAERIREGRIHSIPCPHCGNVGEVYAALLLYLPERDPPLLFSPAQQTTQEKDQQQASVLLGTLRERLGDAWQEQWVSQGLKSVPRTMLPAALSDDPEAASQQLQAQAARENGLTVPSEFADDIHQLQSILGRLQREPHLAPRRVAILERIRKHTEITHYPAFAAAVLNDLGNAYNDSPTGERGVNLAHAIACYEEALRFRTPENTPLEYARTQNNLGNAYAQLPTGERESNLTRAIACYEEALRFRTPETTPFQYANTQNNLGNAYRNLTAGDCEIHLANAIACYEKALSVYTLETTPFQYAGTQNNLGNAHSNLTTGDREAHLARAIACYKKALIVYTPETAPLQYATTQNNLGNAYSKLPIGDQAANLSRAIACYEQALRFRTPETAPHDYAMTQHNLGNTYSKLPIGDRGANLSRAIACYKETLRFRTAEVAPHDYAMTQNNLGNVYLKLPIGDRGANLSRAIACYEEALRFRNPDAAPFQYARTQNSLGEAYRNLPTGDRVMNLMRAIACYEKALHVYTPQAAPFEYAGTQNNLGEAYRNLPVGDQEKHLLQAITCYEEALRFWTLETAPFQYAGAQNNLGNAYRNLPVGDRKANLARAVACYEQALRVYTLEATPHEYAMTQNNLGNAYFELHAGDRKANLARAVTCYEQALQVYTRETAPRDYAMTQNNLGEAYRNLSTGNPSDESSPANLERAVVCYEEALRYRSPEAAPNEHRQTQRNIGFLYFEQEDWEQVIAAYQGALAAGDLLYRAAATPEARRAELREVRELPPELSYALAQTAIDGDSASLQEAVLALEQNRARWLSEALALRSERPPDVPNEVWRRFIAAAEQIRDLQAEARLPEDTLGKRAYTAISQELSSAYAALEEAVDEVRRHAPDFMPISTFADVQAAARVSPLVYITTTSAGGLALIVRDDQITPVWLDALTDEALRERVQRPDDDPELNGYLGAYFSWRNEPHNKDARRAWFAALKETIAWLRATIMEPLQGLLADTAQVILIPTGDLALLPLHAAPSLPGEKRRPVFTYAPNARALAAAQAVATRRMATSLLAVDNPDGSLHASGEEVAAALETFPAAGRAHLRYGAATRQAVLDALLHHDVWQFSTHGFAGWEQPLEGGLLAADGTITLRDLLQLEAEARLAVLSACETGVPGIDLPDEVIGLPTGLLQAGVAGVVGSLWAVNDLSTALLMLRFYQAWRAEGQAPPDALHTAQSWLRESTNADFQAYFKAQLPEFGGAGELPHKVASSAYRRFTFSQDKTARPFAHPFYWAGFYYTGV